MTFVLWYKVVVIALWMQTEMLMRWCKTKPKQRVRQKQKRVHTKVGVDVVGEKSGID